MNKTKRIAITTVRYFLGILMITGGIQHFRNPDAFMAFVPAFLPEKMGVIYLSGLVEIAFGILAIIPGKISEWGCLGILTLLILFLPIHIADVFSDAPAIGSTKAAEIRLAFQLILIWAAYRVYHQVKIDIKSAQP